MTIALSTTALSDSLGVDTLFKKVAWRIMPLLMLCYLFAYLDRVNIGFAKLQMASELGWSDTVYGLGAGIFFLGYFFFEVPSNLMLHRFGARRWIARIMLTWAILSACFAFVSTPMQFYILRFLLGIAEAGFAPGVLLYLTYWFPANRRGKATALYFIAIPLSGVVGGPLSGWIMSSMHTTTFSGWQWLFIVEAIPAAILGFVVLYYLDDSAENAKWLTTEEKAYIKSALSTESADKHDYSSIGEFLKDSRVWLLSITYFCCVMGIYALAFWIPTIVKGAGVKDTFDIGLLTAIPYLAAVVAILISGANSDRTGERRWHFALAMLFGAIGLVLTKSGIVGVTAAIVFLSVAAMGILSATSLFWFFPGALLSGVSAAAGIALINCVGNLAGFASPYMVGWLNDYTGKSEAGMFAISVFLTVGAVLLLAIPKARLSKY